MSYRDDVHHQQTTGRIAREARQRHAPAYANVPKGTRVRLLQVTDIWTDLEPGAEGTVSFVDSMGTVHVNWDSGSNLGLCWPEDKWEVIP